MNLVQHEQSNLVQELAVDMPASCETVPLLRRRHDDPGLVGFAETEVIAIALKIEREKTMSTQIFDATWDGRSLCTLRLDSRCYQSGKSIHWPFPYKEPWSVPCIQPAEGELGEPISLTELNSLQLAFADLCILVDHQHLDHC